MWGFGWVKKAASRVCGAVKAVGRAVVATAKKVKEVCHKGAQFVGKCWKKFTGQDKAEEAERRLAALEERARRRQREFEDFMDEKTRRINAELDRINACRARLNGEMFPRFCSLAGNFSNWRVEDVLDQSEIKLKAVACGPVRGRDELIKIDFRNHPIRTNLAAIFTLGFLTRKRAKESLLAVEEEEARMSEEFARLDAEQVRIVNVLGALEQVTKIFNSHLEVYERVLDEVDYSVELLKGGRNILAGEQTTGSFDLRMLPERHILALKAADAATRIAFALGARRYVEERNEKLSEVGADMAAVRGSARASARVAELLAA